MREVRTFQACILAACLIVASVHAAGADVSPGDVIDKTNWEKAKDLLPEPVLEWVKKGEFVLDVYALKYRVLDFFPPYQLEAFKTNVGKYELDPDGGIVDAKTGETPEHIIGLPFPVIAEEDPRRAEKLMQNNHYMQYMPGHLRFPFQGIWLNRSGYLRETESILIQMALDGYPGALEIKNPGRIEKYIIMALKKPYDLAGSSIMTWRYRDPNKEDNSFAYSPMIRRVRRMSAANRSDALMGSDMAVDDANGYDGKVTAFTWKILRKQETLLPVLDVEPVRIVQNDRGEWVTTKNIKPVIYGYQKEGWQGAPWAPTNLCWVKRPVYIIEMNAKDRYYNYGMTQLWFEPEIYGAAYKIIHDKAGDYWKTMFIGAAACENDDKTLRFYTVALQQMVDDRADRCTVIEDCSPRNIWAYFAEMDINYFSLGGFQKFCK